MGDRLHMYHCQSSQPARQHFCCTAEEAKCRSLQQPLQTTQLTGDKAGRWTRAMSFPHTASRRGGRWRAFTGVLLPAFTSASVRDHFSLGKHSQTHRVFVLFLYSSLQMGFWGYEGHFSKTPLCFCTAKTQVIGSLL